MDIRSLESLNQGPSGLLVIATGGKLLNRFTVPYFLPAEDLSMCCTRAAPTELMYLLAAASVTVNRFQSSCFPNVVVGDDLGPCHPLGIMGLRFNCCSCCTESVVRLLNKSVLLWPAWSYQMCGSCE